MIELLVVMSIIALLMSLLLPAVNTAREAGRRASCANNIRQLGVALNNYHTSHRTFPPSMFVYKDKEKDNQYEDPTKITKPQINWLVCILPLIDAAPVYRKFDLTKPLSDQANMTARSTTIPVLLCPSDSGSTVLFSRAGEGENWARGNYGANASLMPLSTSNMGIYATYWTKGWLRGVMGANVACSIDEIYDGASNTILLAELRIGVNDKDRRGTWALGGPGASSLWGHAYGDDIGPNNCNSSADDILGCQEITSDGSITRTQLQRECMGCASGKPNAQATARSRHAGGVNVCMVDTSTRFVSDYVDRTPTGVRSSDPVKGNWSKDFRVWERINASSDRLPVDPTKL
jgi:prepilin-type processing-associated H-X9-DG protein